MSMSMLFLAVSFLLAFRGLHAQESYWVLPEQVTEVAKALVEHDNQVQASLPDQQQKASQEEGNPLWSNDLQHRTKQAFAAAPRFVLLDFR